LEHIGFIDKNKLAQYRNKIITEEVILTDERIKHIKEHHPGDYEEYSKYLKEIIETPDYILEDEKNTDTVIYLKTIKENNKNLQIVLKLVTKVMNTNHKNSVLTFWKIKEKTLHQLLRNKKIIYKKE